MLISIGVAITVACGHSSDPTPPPAPPKTTPRDAAPPDAAAELQELHPIAGTWGHITPIGPCGMKLVPASDPERKLVVETARKRLGHVGGSATIQLTKLGDRIARVDWRQATAPPKPPRTVADVRALAVALWTRDGDVFGLDRSELDDLETLVATVSDVPGVAWEIHGMLERPMEVTTPIARVGHGQVLVDLDRRGRLVTAKVEDDLLPPLTACAATLDRAAIERAVAGASLEWTSSEGHIVDGKAEIANILSITRTLAEPMNRAFEADEPVELAVVYVVVVTLGDQTGKSWSFQIDPITTKIVGSNPNFMD